jgi:hypothetical protein
MKLDSKYFDMIRVSRGRTEPGAGGGLAGTHCQWRGCKRPGAHRAPRGRGRDNEFVMLCEQHIRDYNQSYNYFVGMSAAEVEEFCKDALTGHRPTWTIGANSWAHGTRAQSPQSDPARAPDFIRTKAQSRHAERARQSRAQSPATRRVLKPLERRSLEALELSEAASRADIKARFKDMVKRHHPDLNGGDRSTEDKLREIIQAYNLLKQAGMA